MSGSSLWILILVLAGGAASTYVKLREVTSQNQALTEENQKQAQQIKNLKSTLLKEHLKEQTEYLSEKTTVEGLEQQLKQAQDTLAAASVRMNRAHNNGGGGDQLGSIRDKISQQRSLIADLENSLRGVRERLKAVNQQDSQNQKGYDVTQKQSNQDAKTQIQAQQDTLNQMIAQQNQLKKQKYDFDAQQKVKDLDYQISQQKALIAQLNEQRAELSQQYSSEKSQAHFVNETQKQELRRSEADLQSQVNNEKTSLAKMEKDVQSGLASKKAHEDEVRSADADFHSAQAKVQEIQAQLQSERQKLQTLSSTAEAQMNNASNNVSGNASGSANAGTAGNASEPPQ